MRSSGLMVMGVEDELARLQAHNEAVIEAVVDGIIIIDETGRIETFNSSAERIFGYDRAEVLGRNVSMLMPATDAAGHDGYMRRYLDGGEARIIGIGRQVEGRRKDGAVFPLELGVGELHGTTPRRFIGTIRDITRRRALENALNAREHELQMLFDHAPIGVFSAALGGQIMRVNQAFCDLLGHDEEVLTGRTVRDLIPESERTAFDAIYGKIRDGRETECRCALHWTRANGELVHVDLHAVSIAVDGGIIIGQVQDRTAQVMTERESREARERLAHVGRVTTLGEMASAIAHEINQPLTAISAYAQASRRLLEGDSPDMAMIDDTLASIAAQALRAGDVVRRIRGFVAHRSSGRSTGDLNEVVRAALEFSDFELTANGIRVEVELAPELPDMTLDTVQMQQVCLNFIRNAIDAMAELPSSSRHLKLRTTIDSERVSLSCTDNGPGVSADMRENLFEPFQTSKADGMGMGLSISASIVRAHGGELRYVDAPDGGATFVAEFPLTEPLIR